MHFDISVHDLDLLSRSQLYEKAEPSVYIFSEILQRIWMKFNMLPQPVGLIDLKFILFYEQADILVKEGARGDSMATMSVLVKRRLLSECLRCQVYKEMTTTCCPRSSKLFC